MAGFGRAIKESYLFLPHSAPACQLSSHDAHGMYMLPLEGRAAELTSTCTLRCPCSLTVGQFSSPGGVGAPVRSWGMRRTFSEMSPGCCEEREEWYQECQSFP
jgi:hypothetical protein